MKDMKSERRASIEQWQGAAMTSQQDSDLAAEAEGAAARQLPVQQALLDGGAAQGKEQRQRGGRRWWRLGGAVLLLLLLLAGAVAALAGQVGQKLEQFVEWVNEHRLAGSLVFVVTYCAATVLCLPATVLSLAAGAIFGVWRGILLIWIGASLGMTAAFFVGRQLLRDWILSWVGDVRIWKVVDLALKEEGWKLVLLLRLAPEVPFSILNYLLSVTSVSPLAYVVASCMGIVPGVALYAYLGSLATDLVHLGSGESRLSRAGSLVGLAVSGIALVLTVVLVSHYGRRALRRIEEQQRQQEQQAEVEAPGAPAAASESQRLLDVGSSAAVGDADSA